MVESLNSILSHVQNKEYPNSLRAIVLKGENHPKVKAFCAGGDVRMVYDSGMGLMENDNGDFTRNFFFDEYRMNYKISQVSMAAGAGTAERGG